MNGRNAVDLRFLGKETQGGGSHTLFDADETMNGKEIYVIQGMEDH